MNRKILHVVRMASMGLVMAAVGTFSYTFYAAFSNPLKMTVIRINEYGEANGEMILLGITLTAMLFMVFDYMRLSWRDVGG